MTAMLFLSLIWATAGAGQGLEVRSSIACPSGQAIVERLAPLLAGHREEGDVAWVDVAEPEPNQPPALRVRLVRADANVIADRRLPIQGACEEMAETVSTVLAAWEAPPTLVPVDVTNPDGFRASPAKVSHRSELWLGASGGAGLLGGIAATGNVELLLTRIGSHLFERLSFAGQSARQVNLGPGDVIWRRTHGSLGLGWQVRRPGPSPAWQVLTSLDVLLGWLTASGHGFAPDTQKTVFEYGFGAGLRGQWTLGGWAVWVETRANLWPAPETAVLTGPSTSSTQLPKLDVLVSLGASLAAFR